MDRRHYRIFVASPGDVSEERRVARDVILSVSQRLGDRGGFTLDPVGYETHATLDAGRPQSLINPLVGTCDVFVGILWSRFGTPTGVAESGTAEEFAEAESLRAQHGERPQIMVFFSDAPVPMDRLRAPNGRPQFDKVQEFRDRYEASGGLAEHYADVYGFERKLRGQLESWCAARFAVSTPAPEANAAQRHVQTMLEAMGYRILDRHHGPGHAEVWMCRAKFGSEWRCDLAVFVAEQIGPGIVEWTRQQVVANPVLSRGIVLSPFSSSDDAASAAKAAQVVDLFTLAEYEARLADFRDYARTLVQEYEQSPIPALYVDLRCRREKGPVGEEVVARLDAFFSQWLAEPGRHHVSLLGDFGAGKSWFCRRLAYQQACRYLADPARERAPVLISLRDYAKAYDIEQAITHALVNQLGVTLSAGYRTFGYLNERGKILLIFDGFDEMERRVADYRTTRENFEELAKVVRPQTQTKVLLTCRTAYFRHRQEEREVLEPQAHARILDREQVIDLGAREGFEVLHLQLFDDDELREALQKRLPEQWEATLAQIKIIHDLPNLAQRPILLDMITRSLDRLRASERINQATLYESYTEELLQRRAAPTQSISPDERRAFIEDLAWDMNVRHLPSIRFDEFPERVRERFRLHDQPEEAAAFFARDIRSQSDYFARDEAGNYAFAHPSFVEFFVARRLYALLRRGEGAGCPVNEAIRSFVAAFAELQPYEYERPGARPDMAYVPPGPFFFGEGPDLRIEQLEKGFFIDVKPVSVGEYLEFVAWVGKAGRKAHAHCHPDEPKRKNHRPDSPPEGILPEGYFSESRYRELPLVLIDWYDAYAFAAWKGKRLPTEQEWEKAARGPFGRVYPWGDNFERALANSAEFWAGRALPDFEIWKQWWESPDARKAMPTRPGEFQGQSLYGCMDMTGNVWEWTASIYKEGEDWKTVRGGSFGDGAQSLRAAVRSNVHPDYRLDDVGFRCAQDP